MSEEFTFDFERQLEPQPSYHVSIHWADHCPEGCDAPQCSNTVCSGGVQRLCAAGGEQIFVEMPIKSLSKPRGRWRPQCLARQWRKRRRRQERQHPTVQTLTL